MISRQEQRQIKYAALPLVNCQCKRCGVEILSKIYEGAQIRKFCNECAIFIKSDAAKKQKEGLVLLDLKCKECGESVKGYYSNRGKTCNDCIRKIKNSKYIKSHHTLTCVKCHIDFEAKKSDRKYCKDCKEREWLPEAVVSEVYKRFSLTCQYCGQFGSISGNRLTIDHIIPLSRNGTDDIDNLILACKRCNSKKGTKTRQEYLIKIRGE